MLESEGPSGVLSDKATSASLINVCSATLEVATPPLEARPKFTGESRFRMTSCDGPVRVWRRPDECNSANHCSKLSEQEVFQSWCEQESLLTAVPTWLLSQEV